VRVRVTGDFSGDPPVSEAVEYEVAAELRSALRR